MKDAREVGGVLRWHQSHVASQFHAVQRDMRTLTTQRKPRCTCDEELECEMRILRQVPRPLSFLSVILKPEHLNPTVTGTLQTRFETCLFR